MPASRNHLAIGCMDNTVWSQCSSSTHILNYFLSVVIFYMHIIKKSSLGELSLLPWQLLTALSIIRWTIVESDRQRTNCELRTPAEHIITHFSRSSLELCVEIQTLIIIGFVKCARWQLTDLRDACWLYQYDQLSIQLKFMDIFFLKSTSYLL